MADASEPMLPELARSLRTLGRPADAAAVAAHAAIFAPLLEARQRATRAGAADAVAALRGAPLAARIEALVRAAAATGIQDPASARARVARAHDLLEPLRVDLLALDGTAADAASAGEGTAAWAIWVGGLRSVFAAADRVCAELAPLLAERPPAAVTGVRWRRGGAPR